MCYQSYRRSNKYKDYFPKHYNINQVIAVFFICNFKVHILVYSIHVHCSLCKEKLCQGYLEALQFISLRDIMVLHMLYCLIECLKSLWSRVHGLCALLTSSTRISILRDSINFFLLLPDGQIQANAGLLGRAYQRQAVL